MSSRARSTASVSAGLVRFRRRGAVIEVRTLWTIGHWNRTLEAFLALLAEHGGVQLADVRRFPASRRHPQFGREALEAALVARAVAYRHFGALGGRRKARRDSAHRAWEETGFRGYADHMDTDEFRSALVELEGWAREAPTAVMCAEASPFECHRRLIADALLARGWQVVHVLGPSRAREHELTAFARLDGERIVYDSGTLALG